MTSYKSQMAKALEKAEPASKYLLCRIVKDGSEGTREIPFMTLDDDFVVDFALRCMKNVIAKQLNEKGEWENYEHNRSSETG